MVGFGITTTLETKAPPINGILQRGMAELLGLGLAGLASVRRRKR